jgi:hypothetical protein
MQLLLAAVCRQRFTHATVDPQQAMVPMRHFGAQSRV